MPDDSVDVLASAARETAMPIRQFLDVLRPHVVEKYNGDPCFTDNIVLQALILNLCAQTVDMIRATHHHKGGLETEQINAINLEASKLVGGCLQEIFAKYIGCDAVIVGKTCGPAKGESGGS